MSTLPISLEPFIYGEHLDRLSGRSLGYRMLRPLSHAGRNREVEELAHHFQTVPYPDHWPTCELFCSILLEDHCRLVAAVRYGVADHTAAKRRGGVEVIGVIGPADLPPEVAVRLFHALRQRPATTEELDKLGMVCSLDDILADAPTDPESPSVSMLPLSTLENECLVFVASSPAAPNEHLNLLDRTTSSSWQWLPLCGEGFPIQKYALRGPLIAWVPPKLDLAFRLERPMQLSPPPKQTSRPWTVITLVAMVVLLLCNVAVLALLWREVASLNELEANRPAPPQKSESQDKLAAKFEEPKKDRSLEVFAEALYQLIVGESPVQPDEKLLERYRQLVLSNENLRTDNERAQALVGLIDQMKGLTPDRIAALIRQEFKDKKGIDPDVIRLISERVQQRLASQLNSKQ